MYPFRGGFPRKKVDLMKDENNFRKMNCDDCQCSICSGACMNCSRCYRAEYAEKDWDDYYVPDNGNKECFEYEN